ncbi:hypothetical protein CS063_12135 [Sporanaerobium hydrogeniformans]|uniref:Uncharacterized protein n=1 Tax=Sporanaerobium hydrogeniformans TaxID=3072179 RepID=A0AC61D9Z1_9FIRM|nr:response regulator [Sporanaerobium hydrogeniformans]PHV70050.1 hypothetical protein CS063_12135 [Sporanaerobium hydrogeniformans]
MYKLLIVDDELLVQIGVKSMLNWEKEAIEVIGMAPNGMQAFEIIQRERPELIITDIKMPVMDGIELIKKCHQELDYEPQFILLTSHEDFSLAKAAVNLDVTEYLIKLELSEEVLKDAIDLAKKRWHKKNVRLGEEQLPSSHNQGKIKELLRNLIEEVPMLVDAKQELAIMAPDLVMGKLAILSFYIQLEDEETLEIKEKERCYEYTINVTHEIIRKEYSAQTIVFKRGYFCVIISTEAKQVSDLQQVVERIITSSLQYFGVQLKVGISELDLGIDRIREGWEQANKVLEANRLGKTILFYSELDESEYEKNSYTSRFIFKVESYIKENIYNRLTLNEVALALNISPNYLSVIFKRKHPCGFSNYVSKVKIKKAKQLLAQGDMKIYEVSDLLNYTNAYYFSKVFKKVTGLTPKEYILTLR